ncbi:hypothetical protein QTN25_006682 [Entamoeba marina]
MDSLVKATTVVSSFAKAFSDVFNAVKDVSKAIIALIVVILFVCLVVSELMSIPGAERCEKSKKLPGLVVLAARAVSPRISIIMLSSSDAAKKMTPILN